MTNTAASAARAGRSIGVPIGIFLHFPLVGCETIRPEVFSGWEEGGRGVGFWNRYDSWLSDARPHITKTYGVRGFQVPPAVNTQHICRFRDPRHVLFSTKSESDSPRLQRPRRETFGSYTIATGTHAHTYNTHALASST